MDELILLIPLYNDWGAFGQLLGQIDRVLCDSGLDARVIVVDDGSTNPAGPGAIETHLKGVTRLDVLKLRRNLGHQRAIAVGLAYVEAHVPCRAVIVMDGDGEDDPRYIPELVAVCEREGYQKIVFAERTKRSERWTFRLSYAVYKFLHHLLTGHRVRVGNFSIIPRSRLYKLAAVSEVWNHYVSAVIKSRQPYVGIPTQRGARLGDRSQMNLTSLIIHGLSAISVYSDQVGVRLLIASSALVLLSLIGLVIIVLVRTLTTLAIPGWATTAFGVLVVILLQSIMFVLVFCFIVLAGRQGPSFMPLRDYEYFIEGLETVCRRP